MLLMVTNLSVFSVKGLCALCGEVDFCHREHGGRHGVTQRLAVN